MAIGAPFGLRPVRRYDGTSWASAVHYLPVTTTRNSSGTIGAIGYGTVVGLGTTGYACPVQSTTATQSASAPISGYGVVVGFGQDLETVKSSLLDAGSGYEGLLLDPDNLMRKYLAYNEAGYVAVVPCAGTEFEIAVVGNNNSTTPGANHVAMPPSLRLIGAKASFGVDGSTAMSGVNTTTGFSTSQLCITSVTTNEASTALTIVGVNSAPDVLENLTSTSSSVYTSLLVNFNPTFLDENGA